MRGDSPLRSTRDRIKPIVDLNLGPQPRYPKLSLWGLPDDADMKQFADIVAMLADRGLRIGQKTILEKLGLPEPAEGEALLAGRADATSYEAAAVAAREAFP